MKSNWKKLFLLVLCGIVFSALSTGIIYRFFPQYLCYAIYAVSKGNAYQSEEKEMVPGTSLTEYFSPQNRYLAGVSIGVKREENDNAVTGRLLDEQGKVMAESQFTLQDVDYTFEFHEWVKPGQHYILEILFPESNQSTIMMVFSSEDSGTDEHIGSYIDGNPSGEEPYVEFIYGTYSRKLLAFWFIVLFVGGFMIGETVLYKLTIRGSSETQKREGI